MSNDLIIPPRPVTPVTARHRERLASVKLDGQPIALADNAPLIPVSDCHAIIAEMDAGLGGCDTAQATWLARKIIGAYPNARPDDPDTYSEVITAAAASCPPDMLMEVFKAVIRREAPFPPVHSEVAAIVAQVTAKRRGAKAVAEAHIREHQRRKDNPPRRWADLSPEEKQAHEERMSAFYALLGGQANQMPLDDRERVSAATKDRIRQQQAPAE